MNAVYWNLAISGREVLTASPGFFQGGEEEEINKLHTTENGGLN